MAPVRMEKEREMRGYGSGCGLEKKNAGPTWIIFALRTMVF
jgi:hypothetical protein